MGGELQPVAGVTRPIPMGGPAAPGVATPASSVLPAPVAGVDVDAALTELLKLTSVLNEEQSKAAKNSADGAAATRKEATEKRQKALNDAIEAARKAAEEQSSGGFFDFITDNLGPAGLLGLCTGCFYIVAADFVAHAVGLDDSKLDLTDAGGLAAMMAGPAGVAIHAAQLCVKKLGPDELQQALDAGPTIADDDVRSANKMALAITQAQTALAVTVATGGTAAPAVVAMVGIALSTTAQVLQQSGATEAVFGDDARWVTLGASLAGAALSCGGGLVSGGGASRSLDAAIQAASTVKTAAQAGHDINQGVRNLAAADYAHDADNHKIDAQRQKHVTEFVERMIDDVISDMKNIKESAQKTTELLQGAMQTQAQTMLLASTMKA